jgi:hypothetical protein
MMQTSADVRLIPRPHALVDSKKTGMSSLPLNSSMRAWRSATGVLPSMRRYAKPSESMRQLKRSRQLVHTENSKMRWPFWTRSGSSARRRWNLADANRSSSDSV